MKPTKLTMILCAAAKLAAAQLVSAQDSPTPIPPPFVKPNLTDVLTRVLLLTDAQKAQLQPYVDAVQPQIEAIHQQARQAEDVLLKQLNGSIRSLLTPEQQTKLDVLEAMHAAGPPPPPQRRSVNPLVAE